MADSSITVFIKEQLAKANQQKPDSVLKEQKKLATKQKNLESAKNTTLNKQKKLNKLETVGKDGIKGGSDDEIKAAKEALGLARRRQSISNAEYKKIKNTQTLATNSAKKELMLKDKTATTLSSMGINSSAKKNAALVQADYQTQGKITKEMKRQHNVQSKIMGQRTRLAMNYLSFLFVGQQISAMFTSMAKTATSTYQQMTAGTNNANKGLTVLGANLKYVQFSVGQAMSDFLTPFMDDIAKWAEFLSDNAGAVAGIILGGIVFGKVTALVGQVALLSASIANIMTNKGASKVISDTVKAVNTDSATVVAASGTGTAATAAGAKAGASAAGAASSTGTTAGEGFLANFADALTTPGGIATITSAIVLLIGAATNTFNDEIESATKNFGTFGDGINVVSDSFAILYNLFRIGLKYITNSLAWLTSVTINGFTTGLETAYNMVKKVVELLTSIELPSFSDTVTKIRNKFEDIRDGSSELADNMSWFSGGAQAGKEFSDQQKEKANLMLEGTSFDFLKSDLNNQKLIDEFNVQREELRKKIEAQNQIDTPGYSYNDTSVSFVNASSMQTKAIEEQASIQAKSTEALEDNIASTEYYVTDVADKEAEKRRNTIELLYEEAKAHQRVNESRSNAYVASLWGKENSSEEETSAFIN